MTTAQDATDAYVAEGANPVETFLTYRLVRTSCRLNAQASRILRDHAGLSLTQWRVMALIGPEGTRTLSDIARQGLVDKGQLSRCVKGMAATGLIRTAPDPGDQRQSFLSLTPKGRRIFERMLPIMQRRQAHLMDSLSADQRAVIFPALDRLLDAALRTEFAS
ncbi:MAG: MarR family transcriptional regulator [Pseudomonadota bacterium]